MKRQFTGLILFFLTGSLFSQEVLVNTRLNSRETIDPEATLHLELRDYFQKYAAPGPVATFTIYMPVPAGMKYLTPELDLSDKPSDDPGTTYTPMMTYELAEGGTYDDPIKYRDDPDFRWEKDLYAADFRWEEYLVEYQLLADEAPITVANFMTYVRDGAYTNTIIHRNESTGWVFRDGGAARFNALAIIQSGGFRIPETNDYLLEWIPTRRAIRFEETRRNEQGTIAMARTATLDSATSQFFMNLENNSGVFGSAYSVFGELVNPEEDQPVLEQFAEAPIYDLSSPTSTGQPAVFPALPFSRIPMYVPAWDDRDSYARFKSVEVSQGDPEGITYSHEWVDLGEEGVDEEEEANRAVFSVRIDGSTLQVSRSDTGEAQLRVTGSDSSGSSASFEIYLIGYNSAAIDQFPSSSIYQEGWLENSWYGWMNAEAYPYILHLNHGYQMVGEESTPNTLYVYDYALKAWLFSNVAIYPNLYHYGIEKWLYFLETSGAEEGSERWFYLFDGDDSRWLMESDL